jgi:hypothetical protein
VGCSLSNTQPDCRYGIDLALSLRSGDSTGQNGAARALLDGVPALQRPCDLDLLVFFAKHPQTLLSSEQLARLLGHELKAVAESLRVLLGAGVLRRSEKHNRTRPARMYVFPAHTMNGGTLPALVKMASTRDGLLALRLALTRSPAGHTDDLATEPVSDEQLERAR